MKTLRDYITETDTWVSTPAAGDEIDFEIAPDEIVSTYVIESTADTLVLAGDDVLLEKIQRYGAVGNGPGIGHNVSIVEQDKEESEKTAEEIEMPAESKQDTDECYFTRMMELAGVADHKFDKQDDVYREDQSAGVVAQKELADRITAPMPGVHEGTGGRDTVEFDIPTFIRMMEYAREDAKDDMDLHDVAEKAIELSQDGHTLTMDDYDVIVGDDADGEEEMMGEAEYQGRKVPLGKPMRGDVKKFKVYVKDPKTGNIKKVNFGHGGTSAKRAGQKTMKIKKSDPKRRKSFRARHRCDNPGPRTKARYWSCRMW